MQKKDQTSTNLCEFKPSVEKESDRKVIALRSDNNSEYVPNEFKKFCAVEGMKREFTTPHNPQQNGVVERKNKSIVWETRVMLHDQGLPLHLWANACNTTVYFHNKSPHQMLGKRLDVGHFRIFGSSVYWHVTKDARKKLEPTMELGICGVH